jgi:hypothetical protein
MAAFCGFAVCLVLLFAAVIHSPSFFTKRTDGLLASLAMSDRFGNLSLHFSAVMMLNKNVRPIEDERWDVRGATSLGSLEANPLSRARRMLML